jgi:hypothetical protein
MVEMCDHFHFIIEMQSFVGNNSGADLLVGSNHGNDNREFPSIPFQYLTDIKVRTCFAPFNGLKP